MTVRSDLLELIADGLEPPERLTVSEWADRYRRLTPEEGAAVHGQWRTYRTPYLREIMDSLGDPRVRRVVVMKAAQVGCTEAGNNWLGWIIDRRPGPVLVVQSTLELMRRWSNTRFARLIETTPSLAAKVGRMPGAKRGPQSTQIRGFPGGLLTVANARSASSLAMLPAREVMLDEVDRYPFDVAGEGDPVKLAEARASSFRDRTVYVLSTPTVKGYSRVESDWLKSDQRRYYCPCPRCGSFQVLVWRQVQWTPIGRPPELAAYVCEECEEPIEDHERAAMIRAGEWRPTAESRIRGYHVPGLLSTLGITIGDLAEQFVASRKDPLQLKVFVNTRLGEPWEERDADRLDGGELMRRRAEWFQPEDEDLRPGVPVGVLVLTAGVDVQADRLEVEVVGWGLGEESWSVDLRVIPGDPTGEPVWADLEAYLLREFVHEDGRRRKIAATCIDTGHLATRCYDFVRRQRRRRVWAIKGHSAAKKRSQRPLWPKRPTKVRKGTVSLYVINVDEAKDTIYARLGIAHPGPGFCHFDHRRDLSYFEQLTAEQRRTEYVRGFPCRIWYLPKGKRNEALDLRVYALAALNGLYSMGRTLQSWGPRAETPPRRRDGELDAGAARGEPQKRGRLVRRRKPWISRRR